MVAQNLAPRFSHVTRLGAVVAMLIAASVLLPSCVSSSVVEERTRSREEPLGNASKLEIWWRPCPDPQYAGTIVYRLFAEQTTLDCAYVYDWLADKGSISERCIRRPDEIVARNSAMIDGEKKKGELRVVVEQTQTFSHRMSVMESNEVTIYFFGDGRWDQPQPWQGVNVADRPMLAGAIFPRDSTYMDTARLVATIELNVPAKARFKVWRQTP